VHIYTNLFTSSRTLSDYQSEICKAIYTTNIIESLNSFRCAVVHRKLFPIDESAMKVIYLTISQAAKK